MSPIIDSALFATHLQKDLNFDAGAGRCRSSSPTFWGSSAVVWGWSADRIGRRWAIIIPAMIAIPLAPLYLFTTIPVDSARL